MSKEAVGGAQQVYDALGQLGIAFKAYDHPPVLTVADAEQYWAKIPATHCKNLFLRNRKGNVHYLVLTEHSKRTDLKRLAAILAEDALMFASSERLQQHLGLLSGAVSPFGLLNDHHHNVRVIIDSECALAEHVGFHPNVNTATVTLSFADFKRFLASRENEVRYVSI